MRRDLLNLEEFDTVTEAQVLVNNFNDEYNHERPHRALNMMAPHEFAQSHKLVGNECLSHTNTGAAGEHGYVQGVSPATLWIVASATLKVDQKVGARQFVQR